jgi:hypothetical protein
MSLDKAMLQDVIRQACPAAVNGRSFASGAIVNKLGRFCVMSLTTSVSCKRSMGSASGQRNGVSDRM